MIKIKERELNIINSLEVLYNEEIISEDKYEIEIFKLDDKYMRLIKLDLIIRISSLDNINKEYYLYIILAKFDKFKEYNDYKYYSLFDDINHYNDLSDDDILYILEDIR